MVPFKLLQKFFCGGRLIFGPDVRSMALTVCLILVPIILFVVFVTPKLATEFSHRFASLIMGITVTFTTYVSLRISFTFFRCSVLYTASSSFILNTKNLLTG